MDIQLVGNEENEDRTQRRKDEAGWMIPFVSGAKEQVGNATAEERSDDAEDDRPNEGQMHVQNGL